MLNKNNKIRILIADDISLDGIKNLPSQHFYLINKVGITNSEIIKHYNSCDVLVIRSIRKIDKSFLEKCNFKIIASCTKGIDHIDVKTAKKKNIKILYSETGNVVSAAEHTFALLLSISKNLFYSNTLVRRNKFSNYDFKRIELRGKKIGIIGFGKVGSRLARYAEAFEMEIFANDINPDVRKKKSNYNFKSLNYVLKNSDIITIHIPLNERNRNFICKDKLKLLNNNAIFINTSRGEIVDEKFLIKLLFDKKIYYAGLDVFENEPKINKLLFKLNNVILTNHIAGKTEDSLKYISNDIFMQVKTYFL